MTEDSRTLFSISDPNLLNVVKVKVVVLEGDVEVAVMYIRYYPGQPYTVKIDTPDGVDRKVDLKAGEQSRSEWDEFCETDRIVTGE